MTEEEMKNNKKAIAVMDETVDRVTNGSSTMMDVMSEMMKNGGDMPPPPAELLKMFARPSQIMDNCMPSSPLPGGDFLKSILTGNNKGHIADILNSISAILGNNGNSKLRLVGMTDGAHIDIELTNLTTLNMALNVINKELELASQKV